MSRCVRTANHGEVTGLILQPMNSGDEANEHLQMQTMYELSVFQSNFLSFKKHV